MDRNLSALLDRAVGGDPEAVADISRFDQPALLEAQVDAGQPLTLTREATVAVLHGLLDHQFTPADVQSWASLMRRGYIAGQTGRGPIEPLEIEFDEACEDAISAAVSRLDEIGDAVDGEVTTSEILDFLQLLGESSPRGRST